MFMIRQFIILLCVMGLRSVFAQQEKFDDLKFENYSSHHELPSDNIQAIAQDKYGFIWLGTQNGLTRFDGVAFKTYRHTDDDENSLFDNDTRSIVADDVGKVWIASRRGLYYYNYPNDNFVKVPFTEKGEPIFFASSPVTDNDGTLWFYSNAGICRMNCRSRSIESYAPADLFGSAYEGNKLYCTSSGNIWCVTANGIYLFDRHANAFKKQRIANDDWFLLKEGFQDIFEGRKDELWIASYHGLYLYDCRQHTIQRFSYHLNNKTDEHIFINSFSQNTPITGDSILWCGTSFRGLALFNLNTKKFIYSFYKDNYDASSIGGSYCFKLFQARDGILWISHINGLSKLDWRDQQIKSHRIRQMEDSSRMISIRKIIPDRFHPENYWLITFGYGVSLYEKKSNNIIRHFEEDADKISLMRSLDGAIDNNGTLWVGSESGLHYYDARLNAFKTVHSKPPNFSVDTSVLKILKDGHDNLWLGTDVGLWKFNISNRKFKKYTVVSPNDSNIVHSTIFALQFDRKGKLFVGSRLGLYVLDTLTERITTMLRPLGKNKTEVNINLVWGIDVDKNNAVWVATRGEGLYKYDQIHKTYTDYKTGNGLTTEEVRDVYVDSLQNVWVSSYDGIFMLDQKTQTFKRYTPEDGLDNYNILWGRWSIINNKIYSGSPGAYSVIDPYVDKSPTAKFPVWITSIKVLNRPIHVSPDSTEWINLPVDFNENDISFEFTAINYTLSTKTKYAYQLVGFDKEWHIAEKQRTAYYSNLLDGHYTFHVKAMNADGLWSDAIATVNIEVKAPFWQTWWFRILVIVSFSALTAVLIRRHISSIRKESVYKQQRAVFGQKLAETEMMALRAQMNPHFIFNCMNIIDGLITDDRKEEAQNFLQKFSKLIRLVLENSQHQLVPLQQDLLALELYVELEAIRSNHSFSYEFDVDERLIENDYKIPPLLLQPYVENAIVHGLRNRESGRGKLLVRIKNHEGKIVITIEDNGIGRKNAMRLNNENKKPHDHLGMKMTGKRIDLLKTMNHNQVEIFVSDVYEDDETGTRINIKLPYHEEPGTRVEINLPYNLDLNNR